MELALFIYMAGLVTKIEVACIMTIILVGGIYMKYSMMCNEKGCSIEYKKTAITAFILPLFLMVVVPSERTMYMMAAGYAGQVVAQKVSSSDSVDKVQKIINNKLDEYLIEQSSKITKGSNK